MESWNVVVVEGSEEDFLLLNKTNTAFKFNKRINPEISTLMSKMEEAGVPLAYTEDVTEVYFTYIISPIHGDYTDGKIRMSYNEGSLPLLERTFVHELGHHVDDSEGLSDDEDIKKEKRTRAKHLNERNVIRADVGEYIAVGFEHFYFGTKEQKDSLKKHNPKLFKALKSIHKKYSAR